MPKISVAEFVAHAPAAMNLRVLAGKKNLARKDIVSPRIQKLGLALANFARYIHPGRIQIVGGSEISYLARLDAEKRAAAIKNLDLDKITCILITKNLPPSAEMLAIAEEFAVPVLQTSLVSSEAISRTVDFLQEKLAEQSTVHGVLLGIYGLGVLLSGKSGIGKSECALDLVSRGHIFVADDTVLVKKIGDKLIGEPHEMTAEHLEIRGLGIVSVSDLFGVPAVRKSQKIDLCIELRKWSEVEEIERLGLDSKVENIGGLLIPKFVLPISSGRNPTILVETAVRIFLMKNAGYDAARNLVAKHSAVLQNPPN